MVATVDADLESEGTIEIQIDGPADYDRLNVIHSLRLAGTFAVALTGEAPDEGQAYDVLDGGTFIDEGYVLEAKFKNMLVYRQPGAD